MTQIIELNTLSDDYIKSVISLSNLIPFDKINICIYDPDRDQFIGFVYDFNLQIFIKTKLDTKKAPYGNFLRKNTLIYNESNSGKVQIDNQNYHSFYGESMLLNDNKTIGSLLLFNKSKIKYQEYLNELELAKNLTKLELNRSILENDLINKNKKIDTISDFSRIGSFRYNFENEEFIISENLKKILGKNNNTPPVIDDFLSMIHNLDSEKIKQLFNQENRPDLNQNIANRFYFNIFKNGELNYLLGSFHYVKNNRDNNIISIYAVIQDITKMKKLENEKMSLDFRMRTMFEISPVGIFVVDSDTGEIYEANEKAASILGTTKDKIENLDWMSITHPDDIEPGILLMEKLNKGEIDQFQMEKRYILEDGKLVNTMIYIKPLGIDNQGRKIHFTIVQDLSDILESKRKALENKKKYKDLFENVNDGIGILNENFQLVEANPKFKEIMGLSEDENIVSIPSFVHPDDKEKSIEYFEMLKKEGKYENYIGRIIKKNNEIRWVNVSSKGVFNKDGRLIGAMDVIRDVTDSMLIRNRANLLNDAINKMSAALIITDENGLVLYVNEYFEETFEYTLDEIRGKKMNLLTSGKHDDAFYEKLWTTVLKGDVFISKITNKTKSGKLIELELTISPVINNELNKKYLIGLYQDISIQEKMFKTITELEEKDILLKEIHHRVKNNIQVIDSLMSLQKSKFSDPKSIQLFNEAKGRLRAMALVHELIYGTKKLSHLKLNEYLNTLIESLINLYSKSSDIKYEHEIDNIEIDLDAVISLGIIINELVTNTFKYAFDEKNKDKKISLKVQKIEKNKFELIYSDNGKGIENEDDYFNKGGIGSKLIISLSKQLKGEIKFDLKNGFTAIIKIPIK